ncbi:MAG TPA: hypothetical protein DCZ92_01210 [Elusimicrobia bacterium]|nr:MAG: hypothetical protein A2016_00125 [Elusimicrobia bacterium GWF2_62_30]HBA59445.1 hypothetical protein [Elusimicrobiota bacterium]
MDKRLSLALLISLAVSAAAGAADFEELYRAPFTLPETTAPAPADKHAATYFLRGLVTVHPDRTVLNTVDGRVFILELSKEDAAAYDNRAVEIWGKVEASDDLDSLRVSSIKEYTPDPAAVAPPPYKSKFKPAQLLGEADGALSVANMRWLNADAAAHDFTWANVVIRPELVKEIYFVTKVQPPGIAGHSLLFFEFEDGGLADSEGRRSRGFFLSVEAYAREGQAYSLVAGFKKTYGIIWLLTNFEDYALGTAAFGKDWMNFYPVLTDRAGKVRMARDTVELAAVNREGEWYHSTRNNCTNNLVMMINHGLPEGKKVKLWTIPHFIYNFYATTPPMVPGFLGRKGVLGPKAFTIDPENYREHIPLPAAR